MLGHPRAASSTSRHATDTADHDRGPSPAPFLYGASLLGPPARAYPARVDVVGYLAGGLAIACLIALAALGDRRVRLAVAAFALAVAICYGLFIGWLALYGE
jgi:hypothetical protein